MTAPITGAGAAAAPAVNPEHERLRGVARDLEGVFVEQLFKAMRESVPDGGVVDGGSGEEMFTGLLDQKMAALAPASWERGLADALYQQLRGRVGGESGVGVSGGQGVRNGVTDTPHPLTPEHPDTLTPDSRIPDTASTLYRSTSTLPEPS